MQPEALEVAISIIKIILLSWYTDDRVTHASGFKYLDSNDYVDNKTVMITNKDNFLRC